SMGENDSRWFTVLLCIQVRLNRSNRGSGGGLFWLRLYSLVMFSYVGAMGGIKKETQCSFHESKNIPVDLI
ncbi:hypothetical protein, partial [Priestia megaterium]